MDWLDLNCLQSGHGPFLRACSGGHIEVVTVLFQAGADLSAEGEVAC
jgi:ankyrin repeat protein